MLHVILWILKIIGIILAVLLGIVLFVLLLILFVPVRYRAFLSKRQTVFVDARVTWMFPFLSVPIEYREEKLSVKIKIFGFTVKDLLAEEEGKMEVKPAKPPAKVEQLQPKEPQPHVSQPKEPQLCGPQPSKIEEPLEKTKKPEQTKKVKKPKKPGILSKLRNLKYTICRFCDKIKQVLKQIQNAKNFVLEEPVKAALKLCLGQSLFLTKKLLPKKVRGEVRFGTEDPALTGEILAGISIFYPVFMDNVRVIPDFEQPCLEGELYIKGKLRMFTLLRIAWNIFFDKNIRYVYTKISKQTKTV